MTGQLELFAGRIQIERIDTEKNMRRFYRMRVQPDLFGGCSLIREWGRIGTNGRQLVERFKDEGQAIDALAKIMRSKHRRGYRPSV